MTSRYQSNGDPYEPALDHRSLSERLADYEAQGWIHRQDYLHYREILEKHPTSEMHLKQIAKELDRVKSQVDHHTSTCKPHRFSTSSIYSSFSDQSDRSDQRPSILVKSKPSTKNLHVSWEDQSRISTTSSSIISSCLQGTASLGSSTSDDQTVQESDKENTSLDARTSLILEPNDLWAGAATVTEQQLQELFVEMCFFARLGFVQPPCCLQCTYRESMSQRKQDEAGATLDHTCSRWVVWRKNAQTLLHPERLDGNILIVRCHVARALLAGREVGGFQWDAPSRKVVLSD